MGRPVSEVEHKRYTFYLPVELLDRVKGRLEGEGISFNGLVRSLLSQWDDEMCDRDRVGERVSSDVDLGGW